MIPSARTRNVTRLFRQASPEDMAAGREWYARASRLASELAHSLPTDHAHYEDVSRAAGVIAVLSPQMSWPLNVRIARQAYRLHQEEWGWIAYRLAEQLPCLRGNATKAARLLTTTEPTDEIVRGPKVRAFWWTIAHPDDPRAVVIDRHAVDVAVNAVTNDETRGKILGRRGGYDQVAATYARAARILSRETCTTCGGTGEDEGGRPNRCEDDCASGLRWGHVTPAEVQAVTWTTWRRTRALAHHDGSTD